MAHTWWPSNPLEETSPVKALKSFTVLCICIVFGLIIGEHKFNKPITGKELRLIAGHMCNNNDGIRDIARSITKPSSFNIQCNDGAHYFKLTITLIDKKDGK